MNRLLLSAEISKHVVIECTVEQLATRLNYENLGNIEYLVYWDEY